MAREIGQVEVISGLTKYYRCPSCGRVYPRYEGWNFCPACTDKNRLVKIEIKIDE